VKSRQENDMNKKIHDFCLAHGNIRIYKTMIGSIGFTDIVDFTISFHREAVLDNIYQNNVLFKEISKRESKWKKMSL